MPTGSLVKQFFSSPQSANLQYERPPTFISSEPSALLFNSMYRSSARPAPLDLPYPVSHSTYNTERRNDVGHSLPQTTVYYESSTRDGLPTPPEDKMATAYQNAPYNNSYSAGRNSEYLSVEAPPSNYGAAYNGNASQSRSYMSLPQPPPASASTLRREVQGSQPLYSQPPSPQPAPRADYLPHEESSSRRSTSGVIRPSLQIPPAICESGGSLAEFAAQVCHDHQSFCSKY